MDKPNDLDQIEQALLQDKITYLEAGEIIYNSSKKPWHTKEWQEKRNQLIKQACEQCDSTEKPQVLQHLWQPRSYKSVVREKYQEYLNNIKDKYAVNEIISIEMVDNYIKKFSVEREACPECNSIKNHLVFH